MKFILICILSYFIFNSADDEWKDGKTDSNGDLIIVELQNIQNSENRALQEIYSVDMPWSVLIYYDDKIQSKYFIFDNIKKKIYSTDSFENFIKEIEKIPNRTLIRKIEKCSAPFDYLMPEDLFEQFYKVLENKECESAPKIMFCYCFAEKLSYPFLN